MTAQRRQSRKADRGRYTAYNGPRKSRRRIIELIEA
jgi:hypothetical protein